MRVIAGALLGLIAATGCPMSAEPKEGAPPPPSTAAPPKPEPPSSSETSSGPAWEKSQPLPPADDLPGGAGKRHREAKPPAPRHHAGGGAPRNAVDDDSFAGELKNPFRDEGPSAPVAAPDFDSIEKTFRTAQASYVIPETMAAGESAHVHLDLSFQKSLDELRAELQKHLPGAEVVTTTLRTSSVAQARLTGQHFQITAITPEEQPVGSSTTTWEWEVTPDSGGRRPLHLSVDAVISIGPDTRRWTINTFERDVLVRVTVARRVKDFVGGNWQWLWTAIVVPAGGWMLVVRRGRGGGRGARRGSARRRT